MSETITYLYGAKRPTTNADAAAEQLRRARVYRNRLIEIERQRREAVEAAVKEFSADVTDATAAVEKLEAELAEARKVAAKANSEARSKEAAKAHRQTILDVRRLLKEARATRKTARQAAFGNVLLKDRLALIDAADLAERKQARAECGVYWGTYLTVEDSMKDARKGAPPQFRRWDGRGKVAIQIQDGVGTDDPNGRPTVLKVGDDSLSLRIGSDGRKPVMAEFPVKFHRPLPPGGKIMWAWAQRRRIGTQEHWYAGFSVRGGERATIERAGSGALGLDVGWRMTDAGLRVACWTASDGSKGELVLPHSLLARRTKSDDLRAIRDRAFNAMRDELAVWLKSGERPQWLVDECQTLTQWRSAERLGRLWWRWKDERFEGDGEMFEKVRAWRKQDRHLWNWGAHNMARLANARKDAYRVFARRMCERVAVCYVEDVDWRKLFARQPVEGDRDGETAMRKHMRTAAVGELIECLKWRFGSGLVKLPSKDTTRRCHTCGHTEAFDAAKLHHACPKCGVVWDQDDNASENLLHDGLASAAVVNGEPDDARGPGTAEGYDGPGASSGQRESEKIAPARGGRWKRRKEKQLA